MKKTLLYAFVLTAFTVKVKAQETWHKTANGVQYHIFTKGTGPKIKPSDIVTFNVVEKTERDSVLFNTYTAGQPLQVQVQPAKNVADPLEIFPMLGAKDSAIVRLPTDSVFKGNEDKRPPYLPAHSSVVFTFKIEKVQSLNEAIAERNAAIEKLKASETAEANKYITANNLVVKTTPSGLKYAFTKFVPQGRKPVAGDTLVVNYTGRTLNGHVFDSSVESVAKEAGLQQPGRTYEPFRFVVGSGQVIPGWDEGLLLMTEGSKATFIIPSKLAYGEQGGGNDIPPYSTLVFDIELVKVHRAPHKAAPAPAKSSAVRKKTAHKTAVKKKTS